MEMENKRKHLELIQNIVTRLSGNLFLLKGWAVTLIVGLFAIAANDLKPSYWIFAFCVLFIFWLLDGYFLSMERCFRALYDEVRFKDEKGIDFSMDSKKYRVGKNTWTGSMFSKTLLIFYGILLASMIVIIMVSTTNIKISFDMSWENNNPINATQ